MPRRPLPQAVTSMHSACQVGVDLGPASPIWGQDEAEAVLSSWQSLAGAAGPQQSKVPDTRVPQQLLPTGRALLSWSPQSRREPWAGGSTLGRAQQSRTCCLPGHTINRPLEPASPQRWLMGWSDPFFRKSEGYRCCSHGPQVPKSFPLMPLAQANTKHAP